jgi:hypothetical protein
MSPVSTGPASRGSWLSSAVDTSIAIAVRVASPKSMIPVMTSGRPGSASRLDLLKSLCRT